MNGETVKELLEEHFGKPRYSLTVGDDGEQDGWIYYCILPQEKQIAAVRDLLNLNHTVDGIGKLPELRQSIPEKGDAGQEEPQCVLFRETDGHWTALFHKITEVHYHRTRGNKIAASLITDVNPYVILSDRDGDFCGFWRKIKTRKRVPYNERPGLSYWMNKAMLTNKRFRGFAADFFFSAAAEEERYILKDVARTIMNCGCFLPPISFEELVEFRTPAELVRSFQEDDTELSVDFNKVDLNVGYVMVSLAARVDRRDWKIISRFDVQAVTPYITLKTFYDGFSAEEFVKRFYAKKLASTEYEDDAFIYAGDYVEMCIAAGDKFRIGYSLNALIRAHDDLVLRIRMETDKEELSRPLLAVPSKFDELERAIKDGGSDEFERIRTTERLLEEGERQHNCVFSRREQVRRDAASIYHWKHGGEDYTVQFIITEKGAYCVNEVRARFNRPITEEHLNDLKKLLKGISTVDDGVDMELARLGDAEPFPPFIFDDDQFELPF